MMNRPCYEGTIQPLIHYLIDQRCRSTRHDGQLDSRILLRILGYERRQTQSSYGFRGSDTQFALWGSIFFDRRDGLLKECTYLLALGKEAQTGFTWLYAAAVPDE